MSTVQTFQATLNGVYIIPSPCNKTPFKYIVGMSKYAPWFLVRVFFPRGNGIDHAITFSHLPLFNNHSTGSSDKLNGQICNASTRQHQIKPIPVPVRVSGWAICQSCSSQLMQQENVQHPKYIRVGHMEI